jgi:hypothetical protein
VLYWGFRSIPGSRSPRGEDLHTTFWERPVKIGVTESENKIEAIIKRGRFEEDILPYPFSSIEQTK